MLSQVKSDKMTVKLYMCLCVSSIYDLNCIVRIYSKHTECASIVLPNIEYKMCVTKHFERKMYLLFSILDIRMRMCVCVCFFLPFVPSVSLLFSINDFPFSIASRHDQFIFGALALYQPTYVCIYFRLKPSQLKTERLAKHFEYMCMQNNTCAAMSSHVFEYVCLCVRVHAVSV